MAVMRNEKNVMSANKKAVKNEKHEKNLGMQRVVLGRNMARRQVF